MRRVAIVTDEPGWHGRRLVEAFARRGAECRYSSLTAARVELDREVAVELQGFDDGMPDAVFVRGVPGGSLEQVVYALNVLHALGDLGVYVFNTGRAIERSVDKCLTTLRLRQQGLPTPETWICRDAQHAKQVVCDQLVRGETLICKPLFGSQGNGISRITSCDQLPEADEVNGVWYLQRFIGSGKETASDWRVFVVGGQVIAAMRRTATGWLSNVAQGARCHAAVPEGEPADLARSAVACLRMAYAGVDLMRDADGRWWLIEVNSVPAWKGLQSVTALDIAGRLADYVLSQCEIRQAHGATS